MSNTVFESKEEETKVLKYLENNPIEAYWDYRDKLNEEQIERIFFHDNPYNGLNEIEHELYLYNLDYIDKEKVTYVEKIKEMFQLHDRENQDDIDQIIFDNIYYDMNMEELLNRSSVNIFITLYSNYDCLSSNYLECQSGYCYKESYFGDMLDFLNINPQGFKKYVKEFYPDGISFTGHFPNKKERNGRNIVSFESLYRELINNSTPGLFVFVKNYSIKEAIRFICEFNSSEYKYLYIEPDTLCGIFCDWLGGGSMLECEIENPHIPIDICKDRGSKSTRIEVSVERDQCCHYTISSVYGVSSDFFQGGGFILEKTKESKTA